MDSRKTPNQPKPGSSSASKFARPRSNRKADANATVLLGSDRNLSRITPTRSLNQTFRRNLDTTVIGTSNPKIKSNIAASTSDLELEYDLCYNEYLQALIKQQIVKKHIEKHIEVLDDQLFVHGENLLKLEITYKELSEKNENLKQQSEIVEVLDVLKNDMDNINELCKKYNTFEGLSQLEHILLEESNLVSVRNIKPICSQEEYDQLISVLNNLSDIMEKIINSERNFEEVNMFANRIRSVMKLKESIEHSAQEVCDLRKKATVSFMQQASDMFALKEGYF